MPILLQSTDKHTPYPETDRRGDITLEGELVSEAGASDNP